MTKLTELYSGERVGEIVSEIIADVIYLNVGVVKNETAKNAEDCAYALRIDIPMFRPRAQSYASALRRASE